MSWASRRRGTYITGVILFFVLVIGIPVAYKILTIPATCTDGIQNQDETAVDKGGRCPVLDERQLQPEAILWARSFRVLDGSYNAVAYVQNSNQQAGVRHAHYRFGLYDANNILVAEREGDMFIMPGAITPVLEPRIYTGNRIAAHTYFCFTDSSSNCEQAGQTLTWERMKNEALPIAVNNKQLSGERSAPRLVAIAGNTSVRDIIGPAFIAVVFDPAGNAFAASATTLDRLESGASSEVVFTWPDPFTIQAGRIDIIPIVAPTMQAPQ